MNPRRVRARTEDQIVFERRLIAIKHGVLAAIEIVIFDTFIMWNIHAPSGRLLPDEV